MCVSLYTFTTIIGVAFQLYRTSAAEARCTHTTFYGHLPYHERPWTDNDTIYDTMSENEQQDIGPALQEGDQQQDATGANAAANHTLNRGGFQPASAMRQPNSEADGFTHRADGSVGAGRRRRSRSAPARAFFKPKINVRGSLER